MKATSQQTANFRYMFVIIILLTGCATPYQKMGTDITGGHTYRRLGKDAFAVSFFGNGFTSPKRATDFAFLRAAEVTLEHGFRYFTIIGEGDLSRTEYIQTGGTAYTTGTVNTYGNYGTHRATTTYSPTVMPVFKPGSELAIRCYTETPDDAHVGKAYTAETVQSEIRAKYKLKE